MTKVSKSNVLEAWKIVKMIELAFFRIKLHWQNLKVNYIFKSTFFVAQSPQIGWYILQSPTFLFMPYRCYSSLHFYGNGLRGILEGVKAVPTIINFLIWKNMWEGKSV